VIVTASDGSLTDSQTITVSMTDANEDVTAPSVTITDNVAGIANINSGAVRFLLTFSEAVTGLALSDFTVTGGTVLGLTPDVGSDGSQYVLEVMPSASSTNPIEITLGANAAQDASGNGSPLTTASQAVDTVAPAAPSAFVLLGSSNSGDPRDTITSNRTPTIAATVEGGATVSLRDSTGTIIGTVQASPEGHAPFTLATLADGTHSYTAQVVDAAGNAGPLSAVLVLTIDTVAPTLSAPVIEGISGADTIVGASEAEGGVSISVTIDGAPVNVTIAGRAATQNGNTWTSVLTAVDGLNSFTIRAFDAAGNTATQNHSFTADLDLTGPADNDTLTGGDGGDTVATGIGDDVVTLGAGDDTFDGGAGNDLVFGGDGRDELDGDTGNDTMLGGAGNDSYFVDSLQDRVYETTSIRGSADAGGVDTVFSSVSFNLDAYAGVRFVERLTLTGSNAINGTGNALDNILTGNNAANVLNGGRGNDTMLGGAGNDIFVVNSDGDRVYETTTTTSGVDAGGTDLVQSAVTFSLAAAVGTSFIENLSLIGQARVNATGNALDNSVTGNSAANVLDGAAGHDTLNGAGGNDTMLGGAGNDVFIVDAARDQVFETTTTASTLDAGGVDRVESAVTFSLAATVGVSFVENLTLTGRGNISGTGNGLNNVLLGNTGANTLSGGDGNDTLDGGAGDDRMIGGAGNDLYIVNSARDRVFETTSVTGTLDAGGQDTMQSAVSQDLNAYLGLRFVEVLHLTGTSNINGLGNSLGNVLHGNSGNNLLDGGAGVDTMLGGAGNDIYVVESTDDLIFETTTTTSGIDAGGIDTVRTSVSYSLGNGAGLQFVENLTLTGSGNVDGRGNGLDNVLTGNAGNNLLDGGAGADTMIGGAGSDIYVVNNAGDRVFETTTSASTVNAGGTDTVQSSVSFSLDASVGVRFVENLYLTGTGAINGTGNALANTLIGNSGDNLLNGGLGVDMLIGGAGADGFVFNTVLSTANIDRIVDFTSGEDVIRLDTTLFLGLDLGAQGADAVSVNGTITADTRLIYEAATGRLFYDADGSGSDAAVHFVTLTAGLTLAADDFFVF
jgi:Ca2+-binding RTX toxin-like protein